MGINDSNEYSKISAKNGNRMQGPDQPGESGSMSPFGIPRKIPRGIPHEGCGGTFILSRDAIQKGLWGHLKCDKCGALADTLQMGIDARDMPGWDADLPRDPSPTAKEKRTRTYAKPDTVPTEGGTNPNVNFGRTRSNIHESMHAKRKKSRLPVALVMVLMTVALLGICWWFGFDLTNVGDAALVYVGDLSVHMNAALDGINEAAGGVGVALDGIGDVAREAADMVGESRSDISEVGGNGATDFIEDPPDHTESVADTPTVPPAVDIQPADTPADKVPTSPLDRTIYPDGSTHGSRFNSEPAADEPGAEQNSQLAKVAAIEDMIHATVNEYRVAAGLPILERDPALDAVARAHSSDMADRNYYGHDTPEGLGPSDRADAAGYECIKDAYGGQYFNRHSYYMAGIAENIHTMEKAWPQTATQIADLLMDGGTYNAEGWRYTTYHIMGWMDSPGHRQNILDGDYGRIGVGVAFSDTGTVYGTQNFC